MNALINFLASTTGETLFIFTGHDEHGREIGFLTPNDGTKPELEAQWLIAEGMTAVEVYRS
jgi:hypothetical protein